jgi:hypothetical protein
LYYVEIVETNRLVLFIIVCWINVYHQDYNTNDLGYFYYFLPTSLIENITIAYCNIFISILVIPLSIILVSFLNDKFKELADFSAIYVLLFQSLTRS